MAKLKTTVTGLEGTLGKRNKEIATLKKQIKGNGGGVGGSELFAELIENVQLARAKNKGQDTPARVQEIAVQLQEVHAIVKILESEKIIEAERATVMMIKCQDEVKALVGKHAKKSPLHKESVQDKRQLAFRKFSITF